MSRCAVASAEDAYIIPSGDVPMVRVKMNAKHEYEFIANFKILQNVFKAKKLDKVFGHCVSA